MPRPTSELILDRLSQLHPKRIDLSLGRMERLLAVLDHPERRLAPVVHIAGTNGKGSTLAMLAAMLRAGGRRLHRYISPHLVHFNERILLHDAPIDEACLAAVLDRCERANGNAPITFFEITTAAALLAFAEAPVDAVLLETGLGGRLDATNVVDRPLLTLIAPVSMDHESYLGSTLAAIAGEKAGILKPGVPAIAGPQRAEAAAVLVARAAAVGAPLRLHGRDWRVDGTASGIVVVDGDSRIELPRPGLAGEHQIENAGLAVMAARALGPLAPDRSAIVRGLREARWPARLQPLTRGPLVAAMPPGSALWLDGGHNPGAGEALARTLSATPDPRPLHLVVGMLSTKDARGFLEPLAAHVASLRAVAVGEHQSHRPADIVATAADLGLQAAAASTPLAAVQAIAGAVRGPVRVLVCGSLYLAGSVLADNG